MAPATAAVSGSRQPTAAGAAADAARSPPSAAADPQGRLRSAAAAGRGPPTADGSAAATPAAPDAATPAATKAARLRFSMGGQPVGFVPQSAPAAPTAAAVLQRDPLRLESHHDLRARCREIKRLDGHLRSFTNMFSCHSTSTHAFSRIRVYNVPKLQAGRSRSAN